MCAPHAHRTDRVARATRDTTDDEIDRLGAEGFGTVVGTARPGGTVGVFIDEYLVWARTPPRGSRKGDPTFGEV